MQSDRTTRICRKCAIDKPIEEFPRKSTAKDGSVTRCKSCRNEDNRQWILANPERAKLIRQRAQNRYREKSFEKVRESQRKYISSPRGQAKREAFKERYRPRHSHNLRVRVCKQHGLKIERYEELLRMQNGVCAICCEPEQKKHKSGVLWSLGIDHDHGCCPGRFGCAKCVRGLLCDKCNRAIGGFGDDLRLFERAIDYLRKGHI